jgi:hypothetical protein
MFLFNSAREILLVLVVTALAYSCASWCAQKRPVGFQVLLGRAFTHLRVVLCRRLRSSTGWLAFTYVSIAVACVIQICAISFIIYIMMKPNNNQVAEESKPMTIGHFHREP